MSSSRSCSFGLDAVAALFVGLRSLLDRTFYNDAHEVCARGATVAGGIGAIA